MRAVGIFLGVIPAAGGMFQYAESILEALRLVHGEGRRIEVAYVDAAWEPILARFPFDRTKLRRGAAGLRFAEWVMALGLGPGLARWVTARCNPLAAQLKRADCAVWIFPAQDSLAYQMHLPTIVAIHDLMHRYEPSFPEAAGILRYAMRERRFRNISEWAKGVLVDSRIGAQHLAESYGTPQAKIYPLPYIPPGHIHGAEPEDFAERYALPAKFLFYPAQFWPHKNHQRLISAAADLLGRHPEIFLVFSGGKRHAYADLAAHARAVGMEHKVAFVGYVPDAYLSGFYRRARAMVMPTFFGPTNIPPLEAFACGCPTAVSDIYGMPEQTGGAALLFDPRSQEQISNTIEALWTDDALCASLRERGYERARQWGQGEFSNRFVQVLAAVLAQIREP